MCESVACHLTATVAAPREDRLAAHQTSQTASWVVLWLSTQLQRVHVSDTSVSSGVSYGLSVAR